MTNRLPGFRLNIIDDRGTVSFLGPAHAAKAVAAACSFGAATWQEVLRRTERYDPEWTRNVRNGILQFDEHNLPEQTDVEIEHREPFRVWNAVTRAFSLQPGKLGLVIFNLKDRRIVQVENHYSLLQPRGRGRIRQNGKPTPQIYHYQLSDDWSIVP